jgi:hypothetical protein
MPLLGQAQKKTSRVRDKQRRGANSAPMEARLVFRARRRGPFWAPSFFFE